MDDFTARRLLASAQRLTDAERGRPASVAEVVAAVGGIQAQDLGAARLGVRARLAGCTAAAVDDALWVERSVVRTWCLRGTLHLIAAEDYAWMVSLLGPVGLARGRARRVELGIDDAAVSRVVAAVADGALSRHEILERVARDERRLVRDPQLAIHLVGAAAQRGLLLQVGVRGDEPVYGAPREWLPDVLAEPFSADRDAALTELARRHVNAFPPSGPEDFQHWSGLSRTESRKAYALIESELEPVEVRDDLRFVPKNASAADDGGVRLLPAFDSVLLGHRDRSLTVRPEHEREVLPGGGVLRPSVLVDGRVEATWRLESGEPRVSPFAPLPPAVSLAVETEAADVVRFRAAS